MSLEGRKIVVVEDDTVMGESLVQSLCLQGCDTLWFQTGRDAATALVSTEPDLVVCDIRLPDIDGHALFRELLDAGHLAPFLFITAFADVDQAVELMRWGAGDYVTKPFDMEDFLERAAQVARRCRVPGAVCSLGTSDAMRNVEETLLKLSQARPSVLLVGESGVGKETCARFLHHADTHAQGPFLAVNCAAMPADKLASEIFGHEPGIASGSDRRHAGFAERAESGTLYLDEVDKLSRPMQAALVRLLEDGGFFPLGGEEFVPFRARLVCASRGDTETLMAEGRLLDALYWKIGAARIDIPPLRERREDIPWLMEQCLSDCERRMSSTVRGISRAAEEMALAHDWPGNVRELRNRVERAVLLSTNGWIMPADLFPERGRRPPDAAAKPVGSLADARAAAERREIERALAYHDGRVTRAAKTLGVSRTTLWEKMRKYGLTSEN